MVLAPGVGRRERVAFVVGRRRAVQRRPRRAGACQRLDDGFERLAGERLGLAGRGPEAGAPQQPPRLGERDRRAERRRRRRSRAAAGWRDRRRRGAPGSPAGDRCGTGALTLGATALWCLRRRWCLRRCLRWCLPGLCAPRACACACPICPSADAQRPSAMPNCPRASVRRPPQARHWQSSAAQTTLRAQCSTFVRSRSGPARVDGGSRAGGRASRRQHERELRPAASGERQRDATDTQEHAARAAAPRDDRGGQPRRLRRRERVGGDRRGRRIATDLLRVLLQPRRVLHGGDRGRARAD